MFFSRLCRRTRQTAAIAFLFAASLASIAHAAGEAACVSEYQIAKAKAADNPSFSIASDEVVNIVAEIAAKNKISIRNVILVECGIFKDKIVAWYHQQDKRPGSKDDILTGEYIIYDPAWVRTALIDQDAQPIGLFSHELAHFAHRHWLNSTDLTIDNEREADEFAGCSLARMERKLAPFQELLMRIRGSVDTTHPSGPNGGALAKKGYLDCGGIVNAVEGTRVLYFTKKIDGTRVEDALRSAAIVFERSPGVMEGPTNSLTCSPNTDIGALRKVALSLIDAGIPIKGIYVNEAPSPLPRITVEYYRLPEYVLSLSKDDIITLDRCTRTLSEKVSPQPIVVRNNCLAGSIKVFVAYQNSNGERKIKSAVLSTNQRYEFKEKSALRYMYSYAVLLRDDISFEWPSQDRSDDDYREKGALSITVDGRDVWAKKRTDSFQFRYSCSDFEN